MKNGTFLLKLPNRINEPGALAFYAFVDSCPPHILSGKPDDLKEFKIEAAKFYRGDVDDRLAREIGSVSGQLKKRQRIIHEVVSRYGTDSPMTVKEAKKFLGDIRSRSHWIDRAGLFEVVDGTSIIPSSVLLFFLKDEGSKVFAAYESVRRKAVECDEIPKRPEGWKWQFSVREQLHKMAYMNKLSFYSEIFPIINDNGEIELTLLNKAYVTLFEKDQHGRFGSTSAVGKIRPYISPKVYSEIVNGGGRVNGYVKKVREAVDLMNWRDVAEFPLPESPYIFMYDDGWSFASCSSPYDFSYVKSKKWVPLSEFLDGMHGVLTPDVGKNT